MSLPSPTRTASKLFTVVIVLLGIGLLVSLIERVARYAIEDHEVSRDKPEIIGLFGGYAYLGLTLIRVWAERTPGFSADAIDLAYFGGADVPEYKVQDWHENPHTTSRGNDPLATHQAPIDFLPNGTEFSYRAKAWFKGHLPPEIEERTRISVLSGPTSAVPCRSRSAS